MCNEFYHHINTNTENRMRVKPLSVTHCINVDPLAFARSSQTKKLSSHDYKAFVCRLCENVVCAVFSVSLTSLRSRTRCNAKVALARQIAMYLCHTSFSILLTEIGQHFGRDRTTVAYACGLVEDKRDDVSFDHKVTQIELLLTDIQSVFKASDLIMEEGEGELDTALAASSNTSTSAGTVCLCQERR